MKRKSFFRMIFSVTGLIVLLKLLGFVKQMIVANSFGATIETDLINLSQGFVGSIQYVLVQALVTSMVSLYIYKCADNEENAKVFAADTLKAFSLVAAALALLVILFAPWISRLIAPTYSQNLADQLTHYLRLYAPALLFFVWTAIFQALLNARKRFIPGELVSLNQSVLLVATILVFSSRLGVDTLTLGFLIYTVWNALYLGILTRRDWKLTKSNPFGNPSVRQLLRMIGPLLLGYSIVYVNQMVDMILVLGLGGGAVTALSYGAVLSNLVSTFIVSFGTILFSYVTSRIVAKNELGAAVLTNRAAVLLTVIFLPISILTVMCSRDIVTIAFARGAFDQAAVNTAALALSGYAFSFVPLVLREVYSRFQYAYQDSKRPMINSSIGIVVNIVLSIVLCSYYGVWGVAFASSVSVCICGILNLLAARRHNAFLRFSDLLSALPLILAGGVACAFAARWSLVQWQSAGSLYRFAMATLCGGGAYLVLVSPLLYRLLKQYRSSHSNSESASLD